jgi:hypothetical protein
LIDSLIEKSASEFSHFSHSKRRFKYFVGQKNQLTNHSTESMEELDYEDILSGLLSREYEEYKLLLLQQLTNKLAEATSEINPIQNKIIKVLLIVLTSTSARTEKGRKEINMALCGLNNATSSEPAAEAFLKVLQDDPQQEKMQQCLHLCITNFLDYNPQAEADIELTPEEWEVTDGWQHLGSVLCNLCQLEPGRKIILQASTGYMERLGPQVRIYLIRLART